MRHPPESRSDVGDAIALDVAADRTLPIDETSAEQAASLAPRTQAPPPPADLASRVQQEQAERAALDKLAQGLGSVSAGQGAADAIQRGDFDAARDQIRSLGEEADQLSEAAKQQLARGLQQASSATGQSDRGLADREQQAAQALSRSTYTDQRQALERAGRPGAAQRLRAAHPLISSSASRLSCSTAATAATEQAAVAECRRCPARPASQQRSVWRASLAVGLAER